MAAVRHMAGDGGKRMAEDAAALGLSAPEPPEPFLVAPENWPAVRLFCRVQGQWRLGPDGARYALDYAGCQAAAVGEGVDWQAEFPRLAAMEAEYLKCIA